jgi:tetratricopeptide (TPR) repeat protein
VALKIAQKIIVILLYIGFSYLYAQNPDIWFNEANKAYTEGDYQQAVDLYSKILEQGIESGEVYFNMGNSYYKMNDIGRAILYYEKAKKYIDGDPALEQNLQLARLRIVDKIEPIPQLFIVEWWSTITHIFSLNSLLWLCISLFSIVILLIIINLLHARQYLRRLIWSSAALSVLIFVITLSRIYEFETTQFGVILEKKVSVVSEPDIGGTEVFILHEGTKVKINRMLNEWLEISIPDGKTGWLRNNYLEVI